MVDSTIKTCPKCSCDLPATTEYWYRDISRKDGLQSLCKHCRSEAKKKKRRENPEWAKKQDKEQYARHSEKKKQRKREWYQRNKEHVRQYDLSRRNIRNAQRREKRHKNPDLAQQEYQEWYRKNGREYHANWRASNPDKVRASKLRRRARKNKLPDTFTKQDWEQALDYFDNCCAACGRQLSDLPNDPSPAADHWIPLSYEGDDNPGTVPWNIVPLCHGLDGCNTKKQAQMPNEWLIKTYGKHKAKEILTRIEIYFQHVR